MARGAPQAPEQAVQEERRSSGEPSAPWRPPGADPPPSREPAADDPHDLKLTARRVSVGTLVVIALVAGAFALWKIRVVIALLFLGITIAAAMRPGVESLRARGVPRAVGILIHYVGIAAVIGVALWLIVPQAIDQVQQALGNNSISRAARQSTGVRHDILVALDRRLHDLPSASELAPSAIEIGRQAFEVVVGIFFTFATAAYWILERDRAVDVVCSLLPRPKRKRVRDTWELIDAKLGAYVRGQLVLVVLVAAVLSLAFYAVGLRYWLLVGCFAGIVELVPVVGPLIAGALAIGVGLTQSIQVAVFAGIAVLVVRQLEDYLIIPRVLGHSVGLSPLIVLTSVTAIGVLFGGFAVILAIPVACVLATLVDVVVRQKDPKDEELPPLLFNRRSTD